MTDLEKGLEAFEKKDYKTALEILLPLADNGDAKAQYIIGSMCERGLGIPQNYRESCRWYDLAYKQNDGMAVFRTGEIHHQGLMGFKQNFDIARGCFNKAALQGISEAQYNLGTIYEKGEGVDVNFIEAHKWYNIAASNGNEDAARERNTIANHMPLKNIKDAQESALSWFQNNPKP